MNKKCYFVEIKPALGRLFKQLDDYGFDYECEEQWYYGAGYVEISVLYYPDEIRDLENIFAPYV